MNKDKLSKPLYGDSSHYNIFDAVDGMALLRSVFPEAEADEMNFALFSTSGVHGTYQTIEEEEVVNGKGVTFVIVHPRIVSLQYGNAYPQNKEDFDFLKKLRQTSKDAVVNSIG